MRQSPVWKVYRDGEYIGSTKSPEDAAALCYAGGVVKYDHKLVVWTEGAEGFPAGESYDGAAEVMRERLRAYQEAAYAKRLNRPDSAPPRGEITIARKDDRS